MKKWMGAMLALLMALCLTAAPNLSRADVGNFAGDSDYGGGSDWGDSDWSDSSWDDDDDWDDDWDSSSSGSGGSSGMDLAVGLIITVTVGLFFYGCCHMLGRAFSRLFRGPQGRRRGRGSLEQLQKLDPNFSEEAFLERVNNMYVQMQNAWTEKKWEPLRIMFTDALFNQLKLQLDDYIEQGQTNHVEHISVLNSFITSYERDRVNDVLTVQLQTRILDYVSDDKTGQVLRGSDKREKFMTYEWTLIRRRGVLTPAGSGVQTLNCPSCGAPLSVNQTGQCAYCGSIVTSGEYDWVISRMRGLAQRTAD